MYDFAIESIRKHAINEDILFTAHALMRMSERKIGLDSVIHCLINGKVIETNEYDEDIKVLFQEQSGRIPRFYSVVAFGRPPRVITVALTDFTVWDYIDGLLRRRNLKFKGEMDE